MTEQCLLLVEKVKRAWFVCGANSCMYVLNNLYDCRGLCCGLGDHESHTGGIRRIDCKKLS